MEYRIRLLCYFLMAIASSQAFAQGEYVQKGRDAVVVGTAGQWADRFNAYGLYLGGVKSGIWDGNVHFILGKDHAQKIQQFGIQVSAYIRTVRDPRVPVGAVRFTLDNLSGPGPGYTVFAPSLHLIWISNDSGRFAVVPSIGVAYAHFSGAQAPSATGQFQVALGFRIRTGGGTTLVLEPGISSIESKGRAVAGAFFSTSLLFRSKSHGREVW